MENRRIKEKKNRQKFEHNLPRSTTDSMIRKLWCDLILGGFVVVHSLFLKNVQL